MTDQSIVRQQARMVWLTDAQIALILNDYIAKDHRLAASGRDGAVVRKLRRTLEEAKGSDA